MRQRVGIILAYCSNYGALLQGYALQKVVQRMGFETEALDYQSGRFNKHIKFYWGIIPYLIETKIRRLKNKQLVEVNDAIHKRNKSEREKNRKEFLRNSIQNYTVYYGYKNLVKSCENLTAVMMGSDQNWMPGALFGNFMSLRFVPKQMRRISYATSLGVSEYPKYCWASARDAWMKIDFLSVREERGKEIIQQICGNIPVQVVCDPTYLLTKKEWEEYMPIVSVESDKYVLCYFLGNDVESFNCAKNFATTKRLKLISILSDESSVPGDTNFSDRIIIGANPNQFINLIRGAEYVITDSFHGIAFSIINEKQFFVIYRRNLRVSQSRNSRIDNILQMWNCQDRLIRDKKINWLNYNENMIDYTKVNYLVESKRKESIEFLKKSLSF